VPKIINIGLDLLELFKHIIGVRFFLRHSVLVNQQVIGVMAVRIEILLTLMYNEFLFG